MRKLFCQLIQEIATIKLYSTVIFISGKERLELQTLFDKYVILHLKLLTDLLENDPYYFLVSKISST